MVPMSHHDRTAGEPRLVQTTEASPTHHRPDRERGSLGPLFRAIGSGYPLLTILARFPFAMVVVGVLTVVVSVRGSVELGGLAAAMVGVGIACVGPLSGAAADRFGHRPTLLIVTALNSTLLGLFAWIVLTPAPTPLLLLFAFLIGASAPQTSPMSRTRLVSSIDRVIEPGRRSRMIASALTFESVADEVSFALGPVVVGVLATLFPPWAPIVGAALFTLASVTAFAMHRTATSVATGAERAITLEPARNLLKRPLVLVVLGAFGAGLCFGATLTSLVSFMQDRGAVGQAGLIYGFMALSSGISAIAATRLPEGFSLRARWLAATAVTSIGALLFATVQSPISAILGLVIMGAGVGPLLVSLFTLGAARTPMGRSATAMTMINTSILVGQAAAGAVIGAVAGSLGTSTALLGPLLATCITFAVGIANFALGKR